MPRPAAATWSGLETPGAPRRADYIEEGAPAPAA